MTKEIQAVADMCCSGRVVSVLEGGYGCQSAANTNYSKPGSFGHRRAPAASSASAAAASAAAAGSGVADELLQLNASGEPVGVSSGAAAASAVSPAAALRESLDRTHLVNAACAHVRALVDPYGHVKPDSPEPAPPAGPR